MFNPGPISERKDVGLYQQRLHQQRSRWCESRTDQARPVDWAYLVHLLHQGTLVRLWSQLSLDGGDGGAHQMLCGRSPTLWDIIEGVCQIPIEDWPERIFLSSPKGAIYLFVQPQANDIMWPTLVLCPMTTPLVSWVLCTCRPYYNHKPATNKRSAARWTHHKWYLRRPHRGRLGPRCMVRIFQTHVAHLGQIRWRTPL